MLKFDKPREVAKEICSLHKTTMSAVALKQLAAIIEPMKILHGKTVVAEGTVCDYIYYLKYGLMVQTYQKNGATLTENIYQEGDFALCIESYFTRRPSHMQILTIEPSILYGLHYDKLFELAFSSTEICRLVFAMQQSLLCISQQRADAMRFESAKERYVRLLTEKPEIVRRAPMHNIASYLQMTPETLSRMRALVHADENTI